MVRAFEHTELFEQFTGACLALASRTTVELRGQHDVVERGHRGQQIEVLKDDAHCPPSIERERAFIHAVDARAGDGDRARSGAIESRDEMKQAALAAARRAHDAVHPCAVDFEINAAQRFDVTRVARGAKFVVLHHPATGNAWRGALQK